MIATVGTSQFVTAPPYEVLVSLTTFFLAKRGDFMGSKAYCNFPNSSLGKIKFFSICLYVYLSGYMLIGLKALTLVRAITLRSVVTLPMFPNLPSIAAQGVERSHWSGILTQSFSSYFATMLGNRHLGIWNKKMNVQWMSPHKVVNELLFFYQRMTAT